MCLFVEFYDLMNLLTQEVLSDSLHIIFGNWLIKLYEYVIGELNMLYDYFQ